MSIFGGLAVSASRRHVQIFIPSVDRDGEAIPNGHSHWIDEAVAVFATAFGGATAFPPGRGAWRDDERDETLVLEDVAIVFSYASDEDMVNDRADSIIAFAKRLGQECNQGEVGILIDGGYCGITDYSEAS